MCNDAGSTCWFTDQVPVLYLSPIESVSPSVLVRLHFLPVKMLSPCLVFYFTISFYRYFGSWVITLDNTEKFFLFCQEVDTHSVRLHFQVAKICLSVYKAQSFRQVNRTSTINYSINILLCSYFIERSNVRRKGIRFLSGISTWHNRFGKRA